MRIGTHALNGSDPNPSRGDGAPARGRGAATGMVDAPTAHATPAGHVARWTGPGLGALVAPAAVVELWTDHPPVDLRLGISRSGRVYRSALVVVRSGTRAIGTVAVGADANGVVAAAQIRAALAPFGRATGPAEAAAPATPRPTVLATGTPMPLPRTSLVVTTPGDADGTVRAVGSILRGTVVPDEVIVVDTGPRGSAVAPRVREWFPGEPIRVVAGPRAGRAEARNAGLAMAAGDVVVFVDDGVIADRDWLERLTEAMVMCDADCATGLSLPLDMDMDAHLELERLTRSTNGFFRRGVYRRTGDAHTDPYTVHPAALTGSRRTLAVWRETAQQVGGFDVRLGAGTPSRGGEDLDFVTRVVERGGCLVQEPAAIVWHGQAGTRGALRREAFGRGVGLSALFAKRLLEGPDRRELLRGLPEGLRDLMAPSHAGVTRHRAGDLERMQMAGIALGPVAFARSCMRRGRRRIITPAPRPTTPQPTT